MAVIIASGSNYNILQGLIAGILMAIGLYFLIWGVSVQWASTIAWNWVALGYYLVSVILLGIGKHLCMACCPSA